MSSWAGKLRHGGGGRLIADGGREGKGCKRCGESGEGSSTVLYTVPGRPTDQLHWATPNLVAEAVWRAGRACPHGATHTYSDSPIPKSYTLFRLGTYELLLSHLCIETLQPYIPNTQPAIP